MIVPPRLFGSGAAAAAATAKGRGGKALDDASGARVVAQMVFERRHEKLSNAAKCVLKDKASNTI